jgi:hypothetical protein
MAEGGGTVSWLTRNDGNSSHYVVEYDGDVVQMVPEAMAAGSMNPKLTRSTNDAAFVYLGSACRYGISALKAVLGAYYADPNAVVIAIEVEGFAAVGPNAHQRAALARLVKDIRRRRGALGTLGHRDQQAYKACPGKKIPWVDYGGHAVKTTATTGSTTPTTGGATVAIKGSNVPEVPTRLTLRDDPTRTGRSRWLYVWSDHRADPGNRQLEPQRPLLLTRFVDADTYAVAYEPAAGDANDTSVEMFVKSADVKSTEAIPLEVPVETNDEGVRDEALSAAITAIEAIRAKTGL